MSTVVTLESPWSFDATLTAIAVTLVFAVLGIIAFLALVAWIMQPRKHSLGEKRKWLQRHGVRTMHPKGK